MSDYRRGRNCPLASADEHVGAARSAPLPTLRELRWVYRRGDWGAYRLQVGHSSNETQSGWFFDLGVELERRRRIGLELYEHGALMATIKRRMVDPLAEFNVVPQFASDAQAKVAGVGVRNFTELCEMELYADVPVEASMVWTARASPAQDARRAQAV